MTKVVSVVGARPQFVKLAPVAEAMTAAGVDHRIVHSGQHYDQALSQSFFADLAIPAPDVNLGVGSGSHGRQTGAMLAALEDVLAAERPDWTLVYGDTNTTLAAALAAVKIHLPVAHLEAGLRSFNRRMPEEHNRVLTDHAADLLLAPTEVAMAHLAREGLGPVSRLVGDVMTDVAHRVADAVRPGWRETAGPGGRGGRASAGFVATIHRPDNTDRPERLAAILEALAGLPRPVSLAVHPRLAARAAEFGLPLERGSLRPIPPLAYPEMVAAILDAAGVVTDSGGLQKEAYLLGRPCTTVRPETEWVETLADGWNQLAADPAAIAAAATRPWPPGPRSQPYGDGHAAAKVVAALLDG
ncbi:MAG: UDP-N-acetylglucosamine 2-epimerase (non-hydrolyzing) [Bifidobacteriaceae bacterium]|jgi:UDP-N-acetylglucosamine 2-epimerase (non-hydrolysing)|nr:UDP-N-acetylglucosamine 2-epimerase (non-hydrolyzing) [Bifidobacteriaceae bacterium]